MTAPGIPKHPIAAGCLRAAAVAAVALAVLVALGWWLAPDEIQPVDGSRPAEGAQSQRSVVWTCSMHPQIRRDRPGKCPLCGMDLTPASDGGGVSGVRISEEGRRLARVETAELRRAEAILEIATVGRFEADDRRVAKLSAWLGGRVESVAIPYVGFFVEKGTPVLDLYVPELPALVAELKATHSLGEEAHRAIVDRLLRAGISRDQVAELERQESPTPRITLYAPIAGVVLERPAQTGLFVKEGDLLAQLAALDPLVLEIKIFERDLAFVGPGAAVSIAVDAIPNETFDGSVESLKPALDEMTRTIPARVVLRNPGGLARPGMFARATIRVPLGADGRPLSGRPQEYARETSIPTIETGAPGPASRPESRPEPETAPAAEPGGAKLPLILPATALLDLGARKIVYVEIEAGHYEPREVRVGPRVGGGYVVTRGVKEGERIVVRGAFLVDSQSQIEGKPSLLDGGKR